MDKFGSIPAPFENPRPPLDNSELERRLADFVQSPYGRADYGIGTYESMIYLTQKLVDMNVDDLRTFYKTLNYMIDIYNQGISCGMLKRRCEEGDDTDRKLFGMLREKIIGLLTTFQIDVQDPKQIDMFKNFYYNICPDDKIEPSLTDRLYWRLRYGHSNRSGGIPDTVPPQEVVTYVRKQLPNL